MTFLVADASSQIRESLCYALLSFGIKGLPVSSKKAALNALKGDTRIEGAIVDLDSHEIEGKELVEELRGSESTHSIKVIAHTVQSSKESVVKMVELGVVGYLLKPYNEEEVYTKLKSILAKSESHNPQRKHIRVKPDPEELLRVSFRVSGHPQLFTGKVVDMSVGGMALELLNPPDEGILQSGTALSKMQFTLSSRQFTTAGKVILSKGSFLAMRFDSLNAGEKTSLARYVFKRIST